MSDPYLLLGVPEDADDTTIHAAYLAALKACPPDRDARRFEAIRQAYEAIGTRKRRLALELFDTAPPTPDDVLNRAAPIGPSRRPDPGLFAALLKETG